MMQGGLSEILRSQYGLDDIDVEFLREGGSRTYLVTGKGKYLLKVIGQAFADTARRSVSIMRCLEKNGFPVPKTVLTLSGDASTVTGSDGEQQLIVLQEYIDGDEPDLEAKAVEVGELTGRLHALLSKCQNGLASRGRHFFIGRYLDFLRQKEYPFMSVYEELGDRLWRRVENLPLGVCHGDLHRGNLLETPDGRIFFLDFDTVCRAPRMFDVTVMCDMTDYFDLKQADAELTKTVYGRFLEGYSRYAKLTAEEVRSFFDWVAIRHFQLQATILEIYGIDCVDERFIDAQLKWLERWTSSYDSF